MQAFNSTEISIIERQKEAAYFKLQQTSKNLIERLGLSRFKNLDEFTYFAALAKLIDDRHSILTASYMPNKELTLLIPQVLSDQRKGNTNCRFSAALLAQIVTDLKDYDNVGLHPNPRDGSPTHITTVILKDSGYYEIHFLKNKLPRIEFIEDYIDPREIFPLTSDGLFRIDNEVMCFED